MKLFEFPHSHFCEKARWALDYKGIPFQVVTILPGFHVVTLRKYAPDTSVPVMVSENKVVQGSSAIIDYLDQKYPACSLTPREVNERQVCLGIERAMDEKLGENIRRIMYHRLLAYPDFIRYCFTHPMSKLKQLVFTLAYPVLRHKIYQTYVISDARVDLARRELDVAMSELEKMLKHKPYLVGEQFTRADLSVASMLSLLVMPPEHPFPWIEIPDPQTTAFVDEYRDHPVHEWVRRIYRNHRSRKSTKSE